MLYTINKCECEEDYDNGCLLPSDGGLYSKEDAISILENGYGGSMRDENDKGYSVNYNPVNNKWLKDI